jgi:hypothetical protein
MNILGRLMYKMTQRMTKKIPQGIASPTPNEALWVNARKRGIAESKRDKRGDVRKKKSRIDNPAQ